MKTKEKVEQGKGTADHLMPLGYLFSLASHRTNLGVSGNVFSFLVGEIGRSVGGLFLARIVDAGRSGQKNPGS